MLDERGERILDAAAELLLRWGYRKITVEDIAREAGVGKGTVYLHWKTKQAVFYTVFMREGLELARAMLANVRTNPDYLLLGPTTAAMYLLIMERPIARAIFTGDTTILGELIDGSEGQRSSLMTTIDSVHDYLDLLRDNGFVRSDRSNAELVYLLDATTMGFYLMPPPELYGTEISHAARAEMMSDAVERVIAAARKPDRRRLAKLRPAAIAAFERMVEAMERSILDSQVS